MARLWFRTRGGPVHGWGNVFRLGSFASWCREQGHHDLLFFVEGPPEVRAWLEARGFPVVVLPEECSLDDEARVLAARGRADVVVVEMLEVTYERQAMLRGHADRLVVFDDLCDHVYCADLVVCGQAVPSTANRALSDPHTRFLTGPRYFLCRPEFLAERGPRAHRERVEHVLVSLGGGRYAVGFLKAARALARLEPRPATTFVLGYADHGDLPSRIRAVLPEAEVLGGVNDLHHRLRETDLALVSAGYHKLEAAITATPAIMVSVQWHQIPLAAEFARLSGYPDAGYMSYVEPEALARRVRHLSPRDVRERLAAQASRVVDGRGFERVYLAIFGASEVGAPSRPG